jgi:Type III restriction enzyme, res subunit
LQVAAAETYRLIRYAGMQKVLFVVDRRESADRAYEALSQYETDDGRRLSDHFSIQIAGPTGIDPESQVVVCTLQRLYHLLIRQAEIPFSDDRPEQDLGDRVTYQPELPVESFDFVWTDEAHRSVFGTLGKVLDYFDAPIVGLTATPTREVAAYFDGNVLMEAGVREPVHHSLLRLNDDALRDVWTRTEAAARTEPRELAMLRLLREGELFLSWRELAGFLERASPFGLSAPALFLIEFLTDYLRDREAEQLVDPAATSPPLLTALLEADAAKQAIGFTPSPDVLRLAEALKADERLNWRLDDLSRPGRPLGTWCFLALASLGS